MNFLSMLCYLAILDVLLLVAACVLTSFAVEGRVLKNETKSRTRVWGRGVGSGDEMWETDDRCPKQLITCLNFLSCYFLTCTNPACLSTNGPNLLVTYSCKEMPTLSKSNLSIGL